MKTEMDYRLSMPEFIIIIAGLFFANKWVARYKRIEAARNKAPKTNVYVTAMENHANPQAMVTGEPQNLKPLWK